MMRVVLVCSCVAVLSVLCCCVSEVWLSSTMLTAMSHFVHNCFAATVSSSFPDEEFTESAVFVFVLSTIRD